MEAKELREVFCQECSSVIADAACDDEDADELAATGQVLVTAYLTEGAPPVQPRAIQQTMQGEIAGVRVRRIVDLLDTEGRALDFKTVSKRPNGVAAEHSLQLTTYAMITPGVGGLCRLDTSPKARRYRWCSRVIRLAPKTGASLKLFTPWCRNPSGTGFAHHITAVP